MNINEWIGYVKSIGGVDTDGVYGRQCMDLYNHYCRKVLGITDNMGARFASEILDNANIAKHFKVVKNYPEYVPPRGAVAIWMGFQYGHVAIVLEANENTFRAFEQNWVYDKRLLTEEIHNYNYGAPLFFLEPYNRSNIDIDVPKNHIHLPANVISWRVYPLNVAPVVGNEKGKLLPSKFGGLDYDVIRWAQDNVAIIKTRDFGEVQIYVGPDTSAVIY